MSALYMLRHGRKDAMRRARNARYYLGDPFLTEGSRRALQETLNVYVRNARMINRALVRELRLRRSYANYQERLRTAL